MKDYKKFIVWQKSHQLVLDIYKHTSSFPKEEIYGLTSQIRRSASSIPTNIAEGAGRHSKKEFLYFLNIARGSLSELDTLLILSHAIGYIEELVMNEFVIRLERISKILNGLVRKINAELTLGR